VFISVEFSILIGVALSILMFIPRAALLRTSELVVGSERVLRERLPDDPPCTSMLLYNLEGELFFGAAPELDRVFDRLKQRTDRENIRFVVLRLKRTRNPDMVSMERFDHFLRDMQARGVTVLLCGVRPAFLRAMENLAFHEWLSPEHVFPEEAEKFSSTLNAVRYAYGLLEKTSCDHCRQNELAISVRKSMYYQV
jgi:SulP family sulfate permease